jgi:hypothetical protein
MTDEIAKQLLRQAETYPQRTEAVRTALSLGMRLDEIETYLDWLDSNRPGGPPDVPDNDLPPADPGPALPSPPNSP